MNSICVIGGGASGMMAAIKASNAGADVTLFEKNDRIGKKILVTGNGKANISNMNVSSGYYYCEDSSFVNNAFSKFTNKDLVLFFVGEGLLVKEKAGGYIYPNCEQASSVLDVLRLALRNNHVTINTCATVVNILKRQNGFKVITQDKKEHCFDKVIIATGGMSGLPRNEKVNGYDLCKKMGLRISKLFPALTQLKCTGANFKALQGVRCECALTIRAENSDTMHQVGEVLFTDYGISGIVAFQVSHYAATLLDSKKKVKVILDLIPNYSADSLTEFVASKYLLHQDETCEEFFTGILNKKLNTEIIKMNGLRPSDCIGGYSKEAVTQTALLMKNFEIEVIDVNGFDSSQVTAGGVLTSELTENMEAKNCPGLYVTGELMDIDGICGGYNLQWAFTTGAIAGQHAAGAPLHS